MKNLNLIFVPIMTAVLIVAIIVLLCQGGQIQSIEGAFGGISVVYSVLYVLLNTANGCVLIANLGQKLSSKQKTQVSFWSALVLCLILLMINIVLLFRPDVFLEEMPLLELFSGPFRQVLSFAIMIGCLTTLFSLTYSLSSSMKGLCKNDYFIFFISVIVPFVFSLLGFGFIVSYLYPLASVIGAAVLIDLTFISFFKRTDKKVHSASKNTK